MRLAVAACALGLIAVASACGSSGTAPRAPVVGCRAETGKRIVLTRSFRFTLLLGKPESMYMPYQVKANHLKHGEGMLRGKMSGPEMMTGGPIRHLEVQICTRRGSQVVTNANPKIVVRDLKTRKSRRLPVAVMQDIAVGARDLHYGNNIAMPAKHHYLVTVTWKDEQAVFRLIAPRA